MTFFEKALTRLIGFLRNAGAGSPQVISKSDPTSALSDKISEAPGKHRIMMANG